jgi:Leucine-rich repeat (LRR) protein
MSATFGLERISMSFEASGTVPEGIEKSLDLSNKQLTELPPEITQLTELQHLDLRGNQLKALPLDIGPLTALRHLNLRANEITTLPPEIEQLTALG